MRNALPITSHRNATPDHYSSNRENHSRKIVRLFSPAFMTLNAGTQKKRTTFHLVAKCVTYNRKSSATNNHPPKPRPHWALEVDKKSTQITTQTPIFSARTPHRSQVFNGNISNPVNFSDNHIFSQLSPATSPPKMKHQRPKSRKFETRLAANYSQNKRLILIGASTGGIDALMEILRHFPEECPPTFIVQHTGHGFGTSLARLLDRQCKAKVELASQSGLIQSGNVIIGAGLNTHLVFKNKEEYALENGEPVSGHLPSVDALFRSASMFGAAASAALLTGMGRDGALGLKCLKEAGAHTIAQNEASSVVYGMPRAAKQLDATIEILPISQIGPALLKAACANVRTKSRS